MKGQVTFINLLVLFITLLTFFILTPVVIPIMDGTVSYLNLHTNQFTPILIPLIYLAWPAMLIAIIITGIYYASPRPEYVR